MKKSIVILITILMLVVFAHAARQTATISRSSGWSQLISVEGRFKVLMPGESSETTSTEQYGPGSFKSHVYSLATKENQFTVYYLDFDKPVTYPDEALSILEEACNKLSQGKGKIKEKQDVLYGDYPGLQCKVEFKGGAEWLRATVIRERLYYVAVRSVTSKKFTDDEYEFFKSFNITIPPLPAIDSASTDEGHDGAGEAVSGVKKLQLLTNPRPDYTEEARQHKVSGFVIVQAIFRANGLITDIRVVRGLPYGLNEEAISAVRKIRFAPAERNGKKVDFKGTIKVSFTLLK